MAEFTPRQRGLISRIQSQRLTYLSDARLASIARTCLAIEEARLPGAFVEAGCALGGSSILIASIKAPERPLLVYDVFDTIPPPTEEDPQDVHDRYRTIAEGKSRGIDGDTYYGYMKDLYAVVCGSFRDFEIDCDKRRVSLIKGLVQDTMKVDCPVAFAHIDVDWYDPVMTCLQRLLPNLVVGGSVILDDYHDWGGCRKAADEHLSGAAGAFALDDAAGSMKLTKVR